MTVKTAEESITETFLDDNISPEQIFELSDAVREDEELAEELQELQENFDDHYEDFSSDNRAIVREATMAWILGSPEDAAELLDGTQPSRESRLVEGLSYKEMGEFHLSAEVLEDLYEEYADQDEYYERIFVNLVESYLNLNEIEEARDWVDDEEDQYDGSPNYLYLDGFVNEMEGFREDALECYDQALEEDPEHLHSLFRKANLLNRQAVETDDPDREPEDYSRELYEKIMNISPAHEGPIMNLGLLYEDQGEFERAKDCYRMILEERPDHEIAELYLGDADASMNLSFREERMRKRVETGKLLNKSVEEFEFPQRILDAFDQLNVETIGDLIQCTEEELLNCDNFGQYSLERVKKFLDERDLSLSKAGRNKVTLKPGPPPDEVDDILRKKIEDFDWSARSKRAMKRLSIYTVKDLVEKTEEELLECQNFGETSLQEVKDTLSELGLSLADSGDSES